MDSWLPEIAAAVAGDPAVIIRAEPGAGKTTRVPPALLAVVGGLILVVEPRRLAASLTATRVAAETGGQPGDLVGYHIRFDSRRSKATRILFITEGLFSRMVHDDPQLRGVGCVVIDEFHERHVQTDLALALVRSLQDGARPDLRLVIMSATLDTAALESWYPAARVFDIPGRQYPVDVRYACGPGEEENRPGLLSEAVAAMLDDPLCPGSILVFLSGHREIMLAVNQLTAVCRKAGAVPLPLTATLPAAEQKKAFDEKLRRVILATNVAETSLTIPGITGVIDSGRARMASHAVWSGLTTLDVKKVPQSSCIQRAGRAGRTGPGICIRLFSERDFLGRNPWLPPEISRSDLCQNLLEVAAIRAAGGLDRRHRGGDPGERGLNQPAFRNKKL